MTAPSLGWKPVIVCCVAGLVAWYFVSMLHFHYGWERLDPLCRRSPNSGGVRVIDDRYTAKAAERMEDVIASKFSPDAVFVDDDGVIYIRPPLYYGYFTGLDRFAQLVVRPEDEPYLVQMPRITCDELEPLLRSPIDTVEWTTHRWPFSLYVIVLQPDWDTLHRWELLYKE